MQEAKLYSSTQIKSYTKDAHLETERLLIPLLKNLSSTEDYVHILQMFYGFYQPLEKAIEPYLLPILPDLQERRKSTWLVRDLKNLRIKPTANVCANVPLIDSPFKALGAMYVLEGSTLGGPIIAKMVHSNPAIAIDDAALGFFSGYKDNNLQMWQVFLSFLEETITNEEELKKTMEAARETFIALKNWILNYSHANQLR